ncbi:hypothetical protein BH20ACI3_BH20ACI3_34510 [soil metagenome]
MKRSFAFSLALLFCALSSTEVLARGNRFKVRYKGGTAASNVKDSNWNNVLTINPDELILETVDGQIVKFSARNILSVNYSQKTTRHASTWVPLGIVVSPHLLWFMLDEKRKHFIGIRYSSGEDDVSGLMIEVKNQDSKAFLFALETVTKMTIKNESVKPKNWYDMN